ncbi:MAG: matrixin family metalloprotease [Pyrinomonadaceae bacterium]
MRWRKQVIRIAVSTSLTQPSSSIKSNSDVLAAVSRSLDAWSEVANIEFRLVTSEKQNVSPPGRAGDGVSLITIAPSPENLLLFSRDPFSEAARTRIFYNRKGDILEADIVLNPFQQFSTDGSYGTFDIETTLAHEIGHLLGLKHSRVIGSLMSDKVARNRLQDTLGKGGAILSESDVTAIRSLYGTVAQEDCCGGITGKLLLQSGKPAKQTTVWAEDTESGLIVGQTESLADGSYRIGGLTRGEYSLFWQRKEKAPGFSSGDIGTAILDANNVLIPTQKISLARSDVELTHIGRDMQLGDAAVDFRAGGEYRIVVGGKNLDVNSVKFEFSSPFLQAELDSMRSEDFGDEVDAVSFILRIDIDAPAGMYSIFGRDRDGRRAALIGSISVQNAFK